MTLRFLLALWFGKKARVLTRFLGRGSGSALPGLVALKIDPTFLQRGLQNLPKGFVVISGTNGKTTTTHMTYAALKASYLSVITNAEGSNLLRGIASAIIEKSSWIGNLNAEIGVFEVDEATLPLLVRMTPPRILVLLNLFRDQLDRYGEVEKVQKNWADALLRLPKTTTLILNADDPLVASLPAGKSKKTFFGIDDREVGHAEAPSHLDIRNCPSCGKKLLMTSFFAAHLSHYRCSSCSFQRPRPEIAAENIVDKHLESTTMTFQASGLSHRVTIPLPGLPAAYGALATLCVSSVLGIPIADTIAAIETLTRPFGRWETLTIGNQNILLVLIKNPAGASAVLETLESESLETLLLALNDNIADGTDVSWIWDAPFEQLPKAKQVIVTGTRADDLALRLKYAEKTVTVIPNLSRAVEEGQSKEGSLTVLATYTAMLDIRKILVGTKIPKCSGSIIPEVLGI